MYFFVDIHRKLVYTKPTHDYFTSLFTFLHNLEIFVFELNAFMSSATPQYLKHLRHYRFTQIIDNNGHKRIIGIDS